ncbi:MAG: methyltransferase domain-containing protein [Bacteroidetes bacterium]|nr:methyltransferase domain-containing protein [Bacteroidota bacterium]
MLALDGQLLSDLLAGLPIISPASTFPSLPAGTIPSLTGYTIADVGCGTGRHWARLYAENPARLIGFDVSQGMLEMLKAKHPQAETHLLEGPILHQLPNASCDLVLSTLTIAHIPDITAALLEWKRALKPGGHIIITDYHPEALAQGGQRTFRDKDRTIAIKNHVHPIHELKEIGRHLGLETTLLIEKKIDSSMRPYYEKQNALSIYERYLGVPIIYGLQLKKSDVAH